MKSGGWNTGPLWLDVFDMTSKFIIPWLLRACFPWTLEVLDEFFARQANFPSPHLFRKVWHLEGACERFGDFKLDFGEPALELASLWLTRCLG